jgi:hypothetical protein
MSRTEEIATAGGRSSRPKTPRRPTYLTLKGGGDRSMLGKRGVTEDVYGTALQRLSDTAKAALPEPQCPGVESAHSSVARLDADARDSHGLKFRLWYALVAGRWLMKPFKGMSAEPTSLSRRSLVTEHGMAYGPRGPRSRSRGSSRGSNAPPGCTGEPCTGQSTTGGRRVRSHAVRAMRRAKMALALSTTTGELTEIERLMVSCASRKGWRVQRETVPPRQESGAV